MNVSVLVWAVTCAVILGLFVFDFYAHDLEHYAATSGSNVSSGIA